MKRRVGRMSEEVGRDIRIGYLFHEYKKKKKKKKKKEEEEEEEEVEMCIL